MTNPLDSFPDEWLVTARIYRSAGKDDRGNPLPSSSALVTGCLYAPRATSDPVDRADITTSEAVLYAPGGTTVKSTDRIVIPQGTFAVDGNPSVWPFGVEIPLRSDHG